MSISSTSWNQTNDHTFVRTKILPGGKSKSKTYEIGKKLGSGVFANIYLLNPPSSKSKQKAIKIFKNQAVAADQNEEKILRILKEKIPGYANYMKGASDGNWIICRKMTLTLAEMSSRLPFWEMLEKLEDLALQLENLHRSGILHKDIHSENIMFHDKDQKLAFIDFGEGKIVDPEDPSYAFQCYQDYGNFITTIRRVLEGYSLDNSQMKEDLRRLYLPEPFENPNGGSIEPSDSKLSPSERSSPHMKILLDRFQKFRAQYDLREKGSSSSSCAIQ